MMKVDKNTCCGCSACVQKCPRGCLSMHPDPFDGFLYPSIETRICVDCGLCDKVCPVHVERQPSNAVEAYAVQNKDRDILIKSSSGGVFSILAEQVLKEGGVVFGARFDEEWQVVIDYTDAICGLAPYRGSKYVQASIGMSYKDARQFLETGRMVLFSGTPCQIAGLRSFLGKEYHNLITIDVICHGVPSPLAWAEYIKEQGKVIQVNFRDKSTGWKNYSVRIGDTLTEHGDNTYMKAFLSNLDLRRCCSDCRYKSGRSGSDITLGDFWGIGITMPSVDDDRGLSCVIANTEKGRDICSSLPVKSMAHINEITRFNPSYSQPSRHHINRNYFFFRLRRDSFNDALKKVTSASIVSKIKRRLFRLINQ